jgi:hypothetical protein
MDDVVLPLTPELARRWWRTKVHWVAHDRSIADDDFDEDVYFSIQAYGTDSEMLAPLVELLVREVPPEGSLWTIGTNVVEDAYSEIGPVRTLDIVSRASISSAELFDVLSGVFPEMLEGMGLRQLPPGRLSVEQTHWLTDSRAEGRSSRL